MAAKNLLNSQITFPSSREKPSQNIIFGHLNIFFPFFLQKRKGTGNKPRGPIFEMQTLTEWLMKLAYQFSIANGIQKAFVCKCSLGYRVHREAHMRSILYCMPGLSKFRKSRNSLTRHFLYSWVDVAYCLMRDLSRIIPGHSKKKIRQKSRPKTDRF